MSETRKYTLWVDGQAVSVSEQVYRAYYKMKRREKYLEESDTAHGKVSYSDMDTEEMSGEEAIPDLSSDSVEDTVINSIMLLKLKECLPLLSDMERKLITHLFWSKKTERECAAIYGISQKGINKRKAKILQKLKVFMKI